MDLRFYFEDESCFPSCHSLAKCRTEQSINLFFKSYLMTTKVNDCHRTVGRCLTRTSLFIASVVICILVAPLCYYFFTTRSASVINRPLCMDGILERKLNNKQSLLMSEEDPDQNHGDCRLHHYRLQDVASCLDQLSLDRRSQSPVHKAFIGESTTRYQFTSLLRVIANFYNNDKLLSTFF